MTFVSSRYYFATSATVAVVASVGIYSLLSQTAHAESSQPPMAFKGRFGFTSLRLHSVTSVNHNTKRLLFELPDSEARSGLSLTSSLLTVSRPQGSFFPVFRPYTPINKLDDPGFVELMVKKYPNGKASSHLHSLSPGDRMTFLGAIKGFPWTANQFPHIYLLAGGAGITPIYQLIQGILSNPHDRTRMTLVFGGNTEEDLLLREELDGFKKRFPDRFDVIYTVSSSSPNLPSSSSLRTGRITKELLEEVMGSTPGVVDQHNTKVFVCGPPAMEEALTKSRGCMRTSGGEEGVLAQLGFSKNQIYKF
ncbi:hypothetical protein ASPZODRAFT_69878 [Penicilliopsis zonata CBS 506.65]|uniref:NADH-cytochrome b5 reductase n=1 Tax=Penicilliopsis zonata CBS 506.65 TaxID=1073090 RepID=A0A1L9SE23_9EURO|nr:hypothetical protein ASPZODRAFT_69878 [Penicilliopsis zonata CBS 506.65]OJJ45456.1 hypothetical protein ASPZODRAFT_69878 [Penicilliopsis zonata CBS 506.65]